ncbi:MAG: AAA family ATPase [Hyphomicrobiales bacterium]|nr:AAA family ATPase [Hyphomicrobiales bacterium]
MPDVENWLDGLGLGQYRKAFVENGIDERALPHLTDIDLQSLGVLLGHRRILLAEIALLSKHVTGAASGTQPSSMVVGGEAERRQLTVMFCDLVGSTALSGELDAEDYRELIRTFHDGCAEAVARYGGYLAKVLGDGLLVYFGYPAAHDDDAHRAVRAALDILAISTGRECLAGDHPSVRIGIASGEVVIGDLVLQGTVEAASALGAIPNLAARLQGMAPPNGILLSEPTRRRLGDGYVMEDVGQIALKGIRDPVQAWHVKGISEPPAEIGGTPFVGREDALGLVTSAWLRAATGKLQIVHVIGQAGIGKSRLVREFCARTSDVVALRWLCSPYHGNTPLHPVPKEYLPDAGAMAAGEAQRRSLFEQISRSLTARIGRKPTVLTIEDGHWIDPTTADLLRSMRDHLDEQPLLMLVASRPGPVADRLAHNIGGTRLELGPLDKTDAEELIAATCGEAMSRSARREILGRAGGLPLFLEELTRVVAQSGSNAIPDSLQDSLQARLDALGPTKRVAQFASAIGHNFAQADLAVVSGLDGVDLENALERLVGDDILVEQGGRYAFRHVLIQDVAYHSLLRGVRRRVHGEIADHVLAGKAEMAAEHLARHLSGAERQAEAASYWREAGHRSALLWAHAEACAHYLAALRDGEKLADTRWELKVRLDLVESLRILDRYDEALAQLDHAENLASRVGHNRDWLRIHTLRGGILFALAKAELCVAANEAALGVARRMEDPEAEARALSGLGDAQLASHRLATAERTYDSCVRIAQANGLQDVVLANLSMRGHMRLYLCRLDEARQDCEEDVAMSVRVGNRRAEITARGSCLGKILLEQGQYDRADHEFSEAARLAAEIGAHRYEALNFIFRGKVALERGFRAEALALGQRGATLARKTGPAFCLPMALGVIARAEAFTDAIRAALDEGEELIEKGTLAHNPLWFNRDAALAVLAQGWAPEARRYAKALRDAFAREPLPWCDLIAEGLEALASSTETGDRAQAAAVGERARGLGFVAWSRTLADA